MVEGKSVVVNVMLSLMSVMSPPPGFTLSKVRNECGMFVMRYMQCCMSVSAVL